MGLRGQKYQKVASGGFSRGLQPRGASAADFYALILALLVLLCESPAFASDVHLAWDANSETTLSGYKLYYGTASRNYATVINVANRTTYTVTALGPGTYYFAVTAYDTLGNESAFSNEVFTTIAGCEYSISPTTQSFTSAAGTGTVSVTAPPGCSWSAESNAGWVTITAGSNGSGSGTVQYAVSVNTAGGSRSGTLSIAGQTFTVSQEAQYLAYFAQFANGSQLVSSIILTNPSRTETATGFVQLLNDLGRPLYTSINRQAATDTIGFTIEPLGTASFVTDGAGDLSAGSVRVSSNVPLGGGVRYFHPELGVAGVGESAPLRALMTVVVRDGQHGLNTGIALHNARASELSLLLSLRDLQGRVVPAGSASVTIPAGGHVAKFIDQFFPDADTFDFQGTLAVRSSDSEAAVAATAIQLGSSRGDFAVLPVVAVDPLAEPSELHFAHFADGSELRTSMMLANPSSSASACVLSFFDDDGNRLPVPLEGQAAAEGAPLTIQPQGAALISTGGESSLVSGSVKVTGTGPVGGVLKFSSRSLGLVGVGSSVPTAGFIVPMTRSKSGQWSTGLAIASTGAPVSVSLTLRNQQGKPVSEGQLELVLRPNGHTARFLEELFPNADTGEFLGTLTVTAEGGTIVGTAIRVGFEEGSLATLPVTPLR